MGEVSGTLEVKRDLSIIFGPVKARSCFYAEKLSFFSSAVMKNIITKDCEKPMLPLVPSSASATMSTLGHLFLQEKHKEMKNSASGSLQNNFMLE